MKKYILIISSIMLLFFMGCDDCPLDEEDNPQLNCQVREVTITEFNPRLEVRTIQLPDGSDSTYFVPVGEYSIHTFEFPIDQSNSGSLPNDQRYEDNEEIVVAKVPFSDGSPYYAAILDVYPLNSNMIGDIMVVNVAEDLSYANIRVNGYLENINDRFESENADDFCDFIDAIGSENVDDLRESASQYGEEVPGASQGDFTNAPIDVVDQNGRIITENPPVVSQEDANEVRALAEGKAFDIRVTPGDVFFYQARNSRSFIFVVADIKEGTFAPHKKRVTIMFNLLD